MSENLFRIPEGTPAPEGESVFGEDIFDDLGSDDGGENPFAGMDAAPDGPPVEEPSAPAESIQANEPIHAEEPAQANELFQVGEPTQPDEPIQPVESIQPVGSIWPTEPEPPSESGATPAPHDPAPATVGQAKASPPPERGEEANPLLAAMDLQDEKNARKAAEPVFAQLPVFSYNGNTEPIENVDQTFEELRLAKADDFPEFDEAQSVSWSVTYGSVSKTVPAPRKARIGDFKREIESSKEFMDSLKKARDKRPKCLVKPSVKMQKKGILTARSYKGVFPSMEEARRSDKTICYIPGRSGLVYERRVTGAGEFVTPAENVTCLDDIRSAFRPALPLIPYALMEQAVSLFRRLMTAGKGAQPLEALVHILWDREKEEFLLHVPRQRVGRVSVEAVLDEAELLDEDRYLHYADLHSHNTMNAVFSKTDDRDEQANRIYMVVGRLDRFYPELSVRVCNGGRFLPIPPELVLEPAPLASFPSDWLERIQCAGEGELEAAA